MTRAGWYPDPFELAPLRWWNGIEWTADTTGPPPFPWSIESSATEHPGRDHVDESPGDGASEVGDGTAGTTAEERLELTPGLGICFTGSAVNAVSESVGRSGLEDLAVRNGLVPCRSVAAMGAGVLVAADPARRSGKVDKARSLGIPVASLDAFLESVETGRALVVVRTPNDDQPVTT